MKYDKFIVKLSGVKRLYVNLLILFIVVALQTPIYHQHVDDNHHIEPISHTDHIAPHHSNDYAIDLHGTDIFQNTLPEKTDHTHNHAHFEKDLFRNNRIERAAVKTASVYNPVSFDVLSKHVLSFSKSSYNPYTLISCSKTYAKTSSGLSPPVYSS